eukprot:563377-Pelagomonas_calceolata.AAC.6
MQGDEARMEDDDDAKMKEEEEAAGLPSCTAAPIVDAAVSLLYAASGFAEVKKRVRTTAGGSTGSVRNLRIREDTAKYLLNLDTNSAYYDPKSRYVGWHWDGLGKGAALCLRSYGLAEGNALVFSTFARSNPYSRLCDL